MEFLGAFLKEHDCIDFFDISITEMILMLFSMLFDAFILAQEQIGRVTGTSLKWIGCICNH